MSTKILIIEDDANLLYGLQAKFRIEGFDTITDEGSDRESLIKKIKTLKPNFIILDLILPKIDGFELLGNIKADPVTAANTIFIFTNLSDLDSKNRGLNLGADCYFIKNDFSLDEFVAKIKKIISNKNKIA